MPRNIFNRIFRRDKTGTRNASPYRQWKHPSPYLVPSLNSTMALSTVYRCVRLISDSIAALPLMSQIYRDGVYHRDPGLLSYLLSTQPDGCTTAPDFISAIVQDVLLWGNGYIIPEYDLRGKLQALRRCQAVSMSYDSVNDVYTAADTINGVVGSYYAHQVCHFRGLSLDGKTGLSVLGFAARTIELGLTALDEAQKRLQNGGTLRGIITNAESRATFAMNSPKEMSNIAEEMEQWYADGHNIYALPRESEFHQTMMSSADMQFLESRKFDIREICRFFGVHPSYVFDDTSNNYKSAENANSEFLTHTLNPLLRKIETELTCKLLGAEARTGNRRISFDRSAIYAFDLTARGRWQKLRLEIGTATPNELRAEDGQARVEGGDEVLVSANLRPLRDLNNYQHTQ